MSNWFVAPRPEPAARIRLFCFPYAGGSSATYRSWISQLPDHVELIAVELPGRAARILEEPLDSLDAVTDELVPRMVPLLDKPYALFGHSMGARIAYATACKIQENGHDSPSDFFASGSRAPHIARDRRSLHDLPRAEFIHELRKLNGTPPEILRDEEMLDLILPFLRADFRIAETRLPIPDNRLAPSVHVFGGMADTDIVPGDLKAWKLFFEGTMSVHLYDGGHFFIETCKSSVVKKVGEILALPA